MLFLDQFGQDFLPGQDIGEADVFHIDHVFGDPHAEGTGRVADHAGQSAEGRFQGDGAAGGQGRITGGHYIVVVAFHHFHRHRAGFQDALEQGSIDMFVEYTGTALLNLLAQPMDTDKDRVWQTVHDLMLEDHGIQTSNPLGYNNTYVMSVKPETAEKYGLTSLSDLH